MIITTSISDGDVTETSGASSVPKATEGEENQKESASESDEIQQRQFGRDGIKKTEANNDTLRGKPNIKSVQ